MVATKSRTGLLLAAAWPSTCIRQAASQAPTRVTIAKAVITVTSPRDAFLLSSTIEAPPRRRHRGGHKRRFCPLGLDLCRAVVRDQQPSAEDVAAAEAEKEATQQRIAEEVAAKQKARAQFQIDLAERAKHIATLKQRLRDELGFDPALEREIASLQAALNADTAQAGALLQQHGNLEAAAAAGLPRNNKPSEKVALRGASKEGLLPSGSAGNGRLGSRPSGNGVDDNNLDLVGAENAPLARVFQKQATRRSRANAIAKKLEIRAAMSGGVLWAKDEDDKDDNNDRSRDGASADNNGESIFDSNVFGSSSSSSGSSSRGSTKASSTIDTGVERPRHDGRKQRGAGRGEGSSHQSHASSSSSGGGNSGGNSSPGKWKRRVRLRYDLPGAGHSGGDAFGNAQEIESHVALAERLGVEIPSSVAREKEGW